MAKRSVTAGNVRVSVLFGLEERILARVRQTIAGWLPPLLERVEAKFASAFKKPTGRLLSSIKAEVYDAERGPRGKVFSDWYVTSFYEFGYGGKPARVQAHLRKHDGAPQWIGEDALAKAKGKWRGTRYSRSSRKRKEFWAKGGHGPVPSGYYAVDEHQRNIKKHAGRWLMKAALDEMAPSIRGALEVAVRKGN